MKRGPWGLDSRFTLTATFGIMEEDNERDFLAGDGDHVSVCGTADIFNCCPSKHQIREATLCNRLVMATFAVVCLWLSSLGVCLSIVQWVIATPTADAVYSSCSYAYQIAVDERDAYKACVDRQLGTCSGAFRESIQDSLDTVLDAFTHNTDLIQRARSLQASCSSATTTMQAGLGKWQEGGTNNIIHYNSDTCPEEDPAACKVHCSMDDTNQNLSCSCKDVASMINDISSVRSEAFTHATSYAEYSVAVVGSIAQYSSDRAACACNLIQCFRRLFIHEKI